MGIDQLGREQAVANELLWTIQVRSYEIEQFCPLHEALFNSPPLLAAKECGYDVKRPRPRASLCVRIDVVSNPIFAPRLVALRPAGDPALPRPEH